MIARDAPGPRPTGLLWLGLAGLSVGLHLWLTRGVLLPLARQQSIEYLFVSATFGAFAALALSACLILLLGHLLLRRFAAPLPDQPQLFTREDVAYVRPLLWLAAYALGLLNLVPGLARVLPVWSYLIVDLRGWWALLVTAWVLVGVDRRLAGMPRAWLARVFLAPTAGPRMAQVTVVAIAVAWAVMSTPNLRFAGTLDGDEPKYVRFCENLYQGLGFEVSNLRPIAQLPPDFRSPWWRNVTLLARTIPGELKSLAADAVAFIAEPSRSFNRSRAIDVGFLIGKNGGRYQLYNPGVSMLMFPAYYLDRRFGTTQAGSPAQWPAELRAVNGFFLGLYALWTLLVFRFLRHVVGSHWVAWIATLTLTLTLPVAAFPFQFYPELAGGVLLFAVAGHLLFAARPRRLVSAMYGLAAGYLPWLHIRFSAMAGVLLIGALVLHRHDVKRAAWFLAGFVVPAACLCLYAYRITGSIMPTAMWSSEGADAVFSSVGAVSTSVAYLLDRDWGLFAHSPVYLFALPGYWWLARRRPDVAWLSLFAFLALLIPAAGHTLHGAGTTPMRLIVAAVPLGAVPLAELLERQGGSRLVLISFALLLLVSLDNALAYNLHHYKGFGPMVDWSFSGWKVNLLFPNDSRAPWRVSWPNAGLYAAWLGVLMTLLLAPSYSHRRRQGGSAPAAMPKIILVPRLALGAIVVFGLLGSGVSAASGAWARAIYRIPTADAADETARRLDELGHCAICLSSISGRVGTRALLDDLQAVAPAVARRQRSPNVVPGYDEWLAMPGRVRAWYIEANGREPANEDIGHHLYQWREERVAPAEIQRRIFAAAGKPVPGRGSE